MLGLVLLLYKMSQMCVYMESLALTFGSRLCILFFFVCVKDVPYSSLLDKKKWSFTFFACWSNNLQVKLEGGIRVMVNFLFIFL